MRTSTQLRQFLCTWALVLGEDQLLILVHERDHIRGLEHLNLRVLKDDVHLRQRYSSCLS